MIENRLKTYEDRMKKSYQNDEATFKLLKEQTQRVVETIDSHKSEKDELASKRKKDIKTLENSVLNQINGQTEHYYEAQNQLNSTFDQKSNALRTEIINDKKERESNVSNLYSNITDEISLLQGELFAERNNREESYDKLIKRLGLEVLRINDTLTQEKKIREESHNQLISSLSSMRNRMVHAIEVIVH